MTEQADAVAVAGLLRGFHEAFAARDVDALADSFTEDALMNSHVHPVERMT